jgi:Cys/Met metabolism PLP-dependent enzyme
VRRAAAHRGGTRAWRPGLVAVDNTLATPLGQRPLELGADFAVASGTKQLTGHGDILLGYVACRDAEPAASVRRWRKIVGAVLGPMEAWLAHRAIATLQLRADRQNANALAVAEALRDRKEVTGLRYPGLPDDASHRIASQQMRRFGCVISFTLPTHARVPTVFWKRSGSWTMRQASAVCVPLPSGAAGGAETRFRKDSFASRPEPRTLMIWCRMCCAHSTSRRTDGFPERHAADPMRPRFAQVHTADGPSLPPRGSDRPGSACEEPQKQG